jgi:hypothetical protein
MKIKVPKVSKETIDVVEHFRSNLVEKFEELAERSKDFTHINLYSRVADIIKQEPYYLEEEE